MCVNKNTSSTIGYIYVVKNSAMLCVSAVLIYMMVDCSIVVNNIHDFIKMVGI